MNREQMSPLEQYWFDRGWQDEHFRRKLKTKFANARQKESYLAGVEYERNR